MNTAGWIFMISSLVFVIGLVVFCFYRVFKAPQSTEHMHAPLDIDTKDNEE